jgi:hypothetical protein
VADIALPNATWALSCDGGSLLIAGSDSGAPVTRIVVRSMSCSARSGDFGKYAFKANIRQSRTPPTAKKYLIKGMMAE